MLPSETVLEKIAPTLIERLKKAQLDRGLKASGRSADSIEYTVTKTGAKWRLELTGAKYWIYQQYGRGPNKKQGRPSTAFVQIIKNWIQVKGLSIPLSAAGAIATKLIREGTNVPNPYNRGGVLTEPLARENIVDLFTAQFKAQYLSYIRIVNK